MNIERTEPPRDDEPPTLAERLHRFYRYLRPIYAHPAGAEYNRSGMYDLEVVVQLLDLPEFAEWLRVHGDPLQSRFAADIDQALHEAEEGATLKEHIERLIPVEEGEGYANAVERASELGERMRQVLIETGALADDDTATDPAALLRALLA